MNIVIIEDESSVAQNLSDLLLEINPQITIVIVLETIRDSIRWFEQNEAPDIAFFDIKIADGTSFEILEKMTLNFPIVFTTAFDEFALKAFKYNSIDYLLKPINKRDLAKAISKFRNLYTSDKAVLKNNEKLLSVIQKMKESSQERIFKKSFLVHFRNQLIPIKIKDIAYFYLENHIVYCKTNTNETYQISSTLEKIVNQLDPSIFFRVNRQCITSRQAVKTVVTFEKRKLKVIVQPKYSDTILISKLKATSFKNWLLEY